MESTEEYDKSRKLYSSSIAKLKADSFRVREKTGVRAQAKRAILEELNHSLQIQADKIVLREKDYLPLQCKNNANDSKQLGGAIGVGSLNNMVSGYNVQPSGSGVQISHGDDVPEHRHHEHDEAKMETQVSNYGDDVGNGDGYVLPLSEKRRQKTGILLSMSPRPPDPISKRLL